MARKLRIAVSVFFGVLTVALAVLWARSYAWYDYAMGHLTATVDYHVYSSRGVIAFTTLAAEFPEANFEGSRQVGSEPQSGRSPTRSVRPGLFGFDWMQGPGKSAQVPYWFMAMLSTIVSALPWIQSRFSLRTLLITTTLVAVVLGLAMWAGR